MVLLEVLLVLAARRFVMADDLDADWKQDHSAIMPSLTKHLKKGGIYFVRTHPSFSGGHLQG